MTCGGGAIRTRYHVHTETRTHVARCDLLTLDKTSWNEEGEHFEEKDCSSSTLISAVPYSQYNGAAATGGGGPYWSVVSSKGQTQLWLKACVIPY